MNFTSLLAFCLASHLLRLAAQPSPRTQCFEGSTLCDHASLFDDIDDAGLSLLQMNARSLPKPAELPKMSAQAVASKLDGASLNVQTPFAHSPLPILDHVNGSNTQKSTATARIPWGIWIFGSVGFLCGVLILWFSELRNVKIRTLTSRGLSECESCSANKVDDSTYGRLVHVQGQVFGLSPVEDPQFQGAVVSNCLKLQSVVEVYEWVQTVKLGQKPHDKKNNIQHTFHKEWSTIHRNSLHFQRSAGKPAPDNPKPPRGLNLGTFTTVCKHVQLGGFLLPEDMTDQFRKFEPAMRYLPPTVQSCGLVFYANKDGYFYARPSMRSMWNSRGGPSTEPTVGDLRVRFLCVPQGVATAVAVHCVKSGMDSFVPYRTVPRGCCSDEDTNRQRLIEEGSRSLSEVKKANQDMTPCLTTNRSCVSCLCCPCQTIQSICTSEVVTEEIYYISDQRDPVEKAFETVVPRNCFRVWIYRIFGWLVCYFTCFAAFGTFGTEALANGGLALYGAWTPALLAGVTSLSVLSLVISIAYLCYSPSQSCTWACVVALVIALPFIVGRLVHGGAV